MRGCTAQGIWRGMPSREATHVRRLHLQHSQVLAPVCPHQQSVISLLVPRRICMQAALVSIAGEQFKQALRLEVKQAAMGSSQQKLPWL